ncbi:sigma-70 family RNA polymerase sigma factor [bacterium]|nr:sigma-70 family RNA polymerase sigma factor [bacterium]
MNSESKEKRFEREALTHWEAVRAFACRLTPDEEERLDLVQTCFENAWRCFDQFQSGTRCRSWLFKILYNAFRMGRRRASRKREVVGLLKEHLHRSYFSSASPRSAESAALDWRLEHETCTALRNLNLAHRSIAFKAWLGQESYQEISTQLGIPIGTVRSRLSRARHQILGSLAGLRSSSTPCETRERSSQSAGGKLGKGRTRH